ncbi:serine/threonine-protein kinase [Bacillus oleivorans]|uniref:Serine/threonine-protein kinase PrkC n=1 Tax=Bacillus oleivorans TaxID=1448271 RepID=A0A285D137_9BACI|nr:Stk1 family PASTA domain-containing Ser/Thr kinase [Bacillus oleivorans]SNX73547.1 serine/threonine-protein kinase [Bacillus oleivorans]
MIIGKRISGRYKIIQMIGGGGMANVYLAHDMILDRDVAIKILRMDFSDNENFIRRFHREAQSATSLAHPNIVSIYDVGEEDDIYYIVMEYVEGMTLKQYIQLHSPLSVHKVIEIMEQLASAIAHAHQNHIVHRDIKPQNILIDKHDVVKITDFGIAMAISATAITQTNSVLGTVHYLSPEQARGGMANKKSDIYSLGIVMFELLTGRLPFSGESAVSIALKHLQNETPSVKGLNPNIPQSVENIVLKATAKDPFHRYESAEELADDLKTALDPDRMNEKPFIVPKDGETTKAIPILKNNKQITNMDETIPRNDRSPQNPQKEPVKKKKKWPWVLGITLFFLLVGGLLAYAILPGMLAPDLIEVPEVSEKTVSEAMNELVSAGFKIGETEEIHDETIEEGLVVKTDPRAGTKLKKGSEIIIYESLGKETYKLPDYVGKQYESVRQVLEDKGFEDEDIEVIEEFSDQLEGTIIDQEPRADEEVIPGETILFFTVSKGPEKIELKDFTGYSQTELTTYANTHELILNITEEFDDEIPQGEVISQDPKPGTMVEKGTTINVVISKGKEEIPPKEETVEVTISYKVDEENQTNEPQLVQIYIEDMNHNITELAEEFEITKDTPHKITLLIPYGGKAVYQIRRDNEVILEETREYPAE